MLRLGMFVAVAALTGCFTSPRYPSTLPALVDVDTTREACPAIAGTYADTGTAVAPDGRVLGAVSLTGLLHARPKVTERADAVVVRGPDGDVVAIDSFQGPRRIATWQQAKVTKEIYLARGDRAVAQTYLCQNGFVRLGRAYDVAATGAPGLLVTSVKSDFLWLRKSTDGSLIALHTDYAYTMIDLVLPLGGLDKMWYRFVPAALPMSRKEADRGSFPAGA